MKLNDVIETIKNKGYEGWDVAYFSRKDDLLGLNYMGIILADNSVGNYIRNARSDKHRLKRITDYFESDITVVEFINKKYNDFTDYERENCGYKDENHKEMYYKNGKYGVAIEHRIKRKGNESVYSSARLSRFGLKSLKMLADDSCHHTDKERNADYSEEQRCPARLLKRVSKIYVS